jgi:hypothetical protein
MFGCLKKKIKLKELTHSKLCIIVKILFNNKLANVIVEFKIILLWDKNNLSSRSLLAITQKGNQKSVIFTVSNDNILFFYIYIILII